MRNQNFWVNGVGTVTVVLENRIVLQGQILRDNCYYQNFPFLQPNVSLANNRFLVLELTCDAALIRDNAQLQTIEPPLYEAGDIVKVTLDEIVSIGPSGGCPEADDVD
ncbi:hypothetical protein [Dendrosporobacter sp. 1207_IL3150]|uniref:hypothetical protein n=1 Tax=Dendrosporobacter sp. 1207_IL3150 TaxID=3084054 RepID=UPI002FD8BD1D